MKLFIFSSGYIACERSRFTPNVDNEWVHLPVPFYLIQHRCKNFLFDTGNPESCVGRKIREDIKENGITVPEEQTVNAALNSIGMAPEQIDVILMSHLHTDHSGGLNMFPNATAVVRTAEYDYAKQQNLEGSLLYRNFLDIEDRKWYQIEDDLPFDVCGDGCMTLLMTPGHTPGHQSLMIKTEEDGMILITADACYNRTNLNQEILAPGLFWNSDAYIKQLRRFRLYEAAGVQLILGHDDNDWKTKRHAPRYYK